MPFPENLKTAFEVEDIVRQQGSVPGKMVKVFQHSHKALKLFKTIPATIAIIDGEVKVGLSKEYCLI
jgi:pseudouridine-5'-phosphate glycosidase